MRIVPATPGPRLDGVVTSLWFLDGQAPPRERILPMASVQVILTMSAPYRLLGPAAQQVPLVFTTGLRRQTVTVANPPRLRHVGVALTLHGGSRIGLPPGEDVTGVAGALGERLAALRRDLVGMLDGGGSPQRLLAATAAVLESELRPASAGWRRTDAALRALEGDASQRISELARALGVSHKTLIEDFRAHVGATPKRVAQLLRVQGLLSRLPASGPQPDWTSVVADSPYADQSHFIRTFRAATGYTPGQFGRVFDV